MSRSVAAGGDWLKLHTGLFLRKKDVSILGRNDRVPFHASGPFFAIAIMEVKPLASSRAVGRNTDRPSFAETSRTDQSNLLGSPISWFCWQPGRSDLGASISCRVRVQALGVPFCTLRTERRVRFVPDGERWKTNESMTGSRVAAES
jgi:hypothetical protein